VIRPVSSRIVSSAKQAMSIQYNTMVYELTQRGKHVLVMSLGEAFFDIPLFPMTGLPYPAVNHYSHSRGVLELRQKLAEYFASAYGAEFNPASEIIVTAGSKAAIHMTLMSIIDPGDEIIYSEPAWVSYPEQIRLCYGIPVGVPAGKSVFDFEAYLTPRTKAIIVNNPHNPSGKVYGREELEHLLDLARRHGLWVLSDEAYSDFTEGGFVSLAALDPGKDHAVVFNSMSKNYGISGWRIGYVIANSRLIEDVLKVNQHLLTCPATILEWYLVRHFHELLEITKPQIKALLERRKELAAFMDEIGLARMPGDATFYFFISIEPSRLGSEEFCTRLLREEYVSVVPGIGYGSSCDRFLRVSIGTASLDENKDGLRKIRRLIEATS
jgi:aspartate aminotransferase/aminotransferase